MTPKQQVRKAYPTAYSQSVPNSFGDKSFEIRSGMTGLYSPLWAVLGKGGTPNEAWAMAAKLIRRQADDDALNAWKPTHKHADGGLYREIGPVTVRSHTRVAWYMEPGVLYENKQGKRFVRLLSEFTTRFKPIKE